MAQSEKKKLALVSSKGALDQAYPALILATTAASMGWETAIFFTFYGLDVINKKKNRKLKVSPLANPAMPVDIPSALAMMPGMELLATRMMKKWMKKGNIPDLVKFIEMAKELGVRFIACSTTMGIMNVAEKDLIPGCEIAGAAAFLDFAGTADVQLFI